MRSAACNLHHCSALPRRRHAARRHNRKQSDGAAGRWERRLEARAALLTRGFEARAAALARSADELQREQADRAIELAAFERLAGDEAAALGARLAAAGERAADEARREALLQAKYADLVAEIDQLEERRALAAAAAGGR